MNNSVVNLTAIGETENFLICYTDRIDCCRRIDNPKNRSFGSYSLPDGSNVISKVDANSSMFSRSRNKQAVILHRGSNALGPSGVYTCSIPNKNDISQILYFGIYSHNKGMLKCAWSIIII